MVNRGSSIVALALLVALVVSGTAVADSRRPNVLLLCADDHAAYVSGAYGNSLVRTPRLDGLMAAGLRFDRAYCNSPVCTASRQSFLTGRYPRTIGVTRLQTPLPESETTLAELLAGAGYRTASIGKMHFNSPLKHGFELRVDLPDYQQWLRAQPPEPLPAELAVQPAWRPFKDPARVWLNSECRPIGQKAARMDASFFAERAAEYLSKAGEQPFFLMVSFYEPHSPYRFPIEYAGRHQADPFPVPTVGPDDARQIPQEFRDLTDREKQGIAAAYYTSVEFMDASVGRVLDALEASGHRDDTLVVYLGDHGYLLGQHGRFEKHCSYEEAVRVPLAMRFPGRIAAGRASEAFVELVDLAPTICELTGVAPPAAMQGRSLAPLTTGKSDTHRSHVIVEYAQNEEIMIRDARWKLIYERGATRRTDGYDTGLAMTRNWLRLFDLAADPQEMTNLAEKSEHAGEVERLSRLLAEQLKATARLPEHLPPDDDTLTVLDHCVRSRDVEPPAGK